MKCHILFSRKNKKNITNLSSAESAHKCFNNVVKSFNNELIPCPRTNKLKISCLTRGKEDKLENQGLVLQQP